VSRWQSGLRRRRARADELAVAREISAGNEQTCSRRRCGSPDRSPPPRSTPPWPDGVGRMYAVGAGFADERAVAAPFAMPCLNGRRSRSSECRLRCCHATRRDEVARAPRFRVGLQGRAMAAHSPGSHSSRSLVAAG
jgi:hypothetical protein